MDRAFKKFSEAFNQREPRERAIIVAAVLLCLFTVWDQLFYTPMEEKLSELESQQARLEAQSQTAQNTLLKTLNASTSPEDDVRQLELSALQSSIERLDSQIQSLDNLAIPPDLMPSMLEKLLSAHKNLKLLSLKNTAPQQVPAEEDPTLGRVKIYKHGMQVSLEGNYMATAKYLLDIENLPWTMLFDKLTFKTLDYPNSKIEIELGTVSLSEEWIGV